jgi:LemA protein
MKIVKIVLMVVSAFLLSSCSINNIPTYQEDVKAKWAQVENQYQRRAELIPNLVATVKGYAAHEKETLDAVITARAKATSMTIPPDGLSPELLAQYQANQNALSSALSRLMVVVEKYPELKANQNFLSLQSQLEGTENRIAVARRDYIEAVRIYNTELKTYPGKIWHAILYSEYKPEPVFDVPAEVEKAPEVKF